MLREFLGKKREIKGARIYEPNICLVSSKSIFYEAKDHSWENERQDLGTEINFRNCGRI